MPVVLLLPAAQIEQLGDETRGLQLVELPHPDAEAIERSLLDSVPVEVVLFNELEDELFLLVRAGPTVRAAILRQRRRVAVGWWNSLGRLVETVFLIRDEADGLDFPVDRILKEMVDPGGLALDVSGVAQLGLHGDAELVTGVSGQAESFGVVADELDCHVGGFPFLLVLDEPSRNEKARPRKEDGLRFRWSLGFAGDPIS